MSEIKVNKISPKQTCTQLTLGDSGDTIIIPAGATITNNGTATGFGRTGTVDWDTTPKTTTVTAVSGVGYFVNTTSGAITVNLPAGVAGAIVAVSDYANTAATNNITISPNSTDKINGTNQSTKITTNGASATLIYIDSTRGWKDVNDATLDLTGIPPFVAATGGTILTCGDFKTHVFTGPGTFTVTSAGGPAGSNSVEYLVVAGGGGGATGSYMGGGGAGGYRTSFPSPTTAGLPVTAQAYPITVGSGGTSGPSPNTSGTPGSNSIFSTITSTGGGTSNSTPVNGAPGGSGGGGRSDGDGPGTGGSGNTPPTSPPQGNSGGQGGTPGGGYGGAGGGGAGAAGTTGAPPAPATAGSGGVGSPIATTFFGPTSPSYGTPGPAPGRYFAGGGGGANDANRPYTLTTSEGAGGAGGGGQSGQPNYVIQSGPAKNRSSVAGTANTGGGGGGGAYCGTNITGSAGGSGIVVIRYKFQ
jgi:hypothetical protein